MKYQILGEPLPVVEIELDQNETIVTEGGGMSWMSNNLEMKTSAGGVGKALGRMFSGESLFLNYYTA
ncbi:MAG: AIM24 family protein, partial [Erysipelothrix sp.]|nr:AIM24 family protein [Erysipelothrix sp.]